MLKVTINNGVSPERSIYINDLVDVKVVQDAVIDEYQKVLAQDVEDERIEIERLLDAAPDDVETISDLQKWIEGICEVVDGNVVDLEDLKDMKCQLDGSDYDSVEDMLERIDTLEEAIDSIYWSVKDVRP